MSPLLKRLRLGAILLVGIMTIAVIGYMTLGHAKFLDALYMAIITIAGVGYEETVPTAAHPILRTFNMFVVVVGVGINVYVLSVVTAFLVEGEIRNLFWRRKMQKRINELVEHFVVCGLGDTGRHAVEELHRTKTPYVVIEANEDNIKKFRLVAASNEFDEMLYVIGDATDETVLDQAGIERAKGMIAALGTDKDNLVTTLMARQKNAEMRIVTRCIDARYQERMLKAGANSTVSPNRIGGMRMASEALRPHVVGFLDLMLREHSRTLRIEEIDVYPGSPWIGSELRQLNLRNRFNLLVLATKGQKSDTHDGHFHPNPPDEAIVTAGTVVIVMGDVQDLHKARQEAAQGTHPGKHVSAAK